MPLPCHRIVKEEGVSGLFRGATPTVVRAMALNMGMLASNEQAKEMLEAAGAEEGVWWGKQGRGGMAACATACATCFWLVGLALSSHALPVLPACCVPGGPVAVLGGAFIAGFFASACSLPFDFVKTRMQKMTPNPDGTMPYKSAMDCAMQTLKQEGFLKFYTGFGTYVTR